MRRNVPGIFLRIAWAKFRARVYVSASRKLRLQLRQSIVSLGPSLRSFHSPPSPPLFPPPLLPSCYRRLTIFRSEDCPFFSERDAKSSPSGPMVSILGTRERGRLFFIPTGVERVAIPRGEPPWSCKSYEQVIREGRRKGKRKPRGRGEGEGENACDSLLVTRIDRPA